MDIILFFVSLIQVFYIPLNFGLELDFDSNPSVMVFFKDLPFATYLLKILIRFNTSYYSQGKMQ